MYVRGILSLALVACAVAAPEQKAKRQDISKLLDLASDAGITLPTDPAALIALGPLANSLASALPTAPVLSVLETAAPSGFLSQILHDPTFASSFQSAFAAGSSPSWFNALPTDVRSYLHTYTNFGVAATVAGGAIGSLTPSATSGGSASTGTASTSSSPMMTSTSAAMSSETSVAAASEAGPSSTTSAGGAAQHTGTIAAGLAWCVGILGLAVAL
ncbi:hypothetical protein MMC24_000231 [Lignoscripta atroalba]|nr:hypothetical protein [Lignoscripta atroalba]